MSIAPTSEYANLPDAALQQALQMAQRSNDTMKFLSIKAELDKRAKERVAAQGQQAGQQMASQGPQTIADKVASGVANLPIHNPGYANGGIVAFAGGGGAEDEYQSPLEVLWSKAKPAAKSAMDWLWAHGDYAANNTDQRGPQDMSNYVSRAPAVQPAPMYSPTTPGAVPTTDVPEKPTGIDALIKGALSARAPVGVGFKPAAAGPIDSKINVDKTESAEEKEARAEQMATKANEGLSAIYKRMADRDAAKQAKLEAETQDKEGLLGFKMSPAVREALLRAGIGAMSSKSTTALGGIGEGLAAGADAYKEGEKRRTSRQDLLDDAADKRALAEIAAKQGNVDRARGYMADAAKDKNDAFTIGLKKAELGQKDKELMEAARGHDLTYAAHLEQMANQLKVAGITASSHLAAARLPAADVQLVQKMIDDPKFAAAYKDLLGLRSAGSADLAAWKTYASDPAKLEALRTEDPVYYAQVKAKIQAQLSGGAGAAGNAPIRER